ncbi:uncharacterized protein SETTUDRAFT_164149 [Exserohilum turcica Et28A]|uniref:Uncharacterized protein n=1 Tax=Exserohilum turcicum (strain 28A) TaxID=671987 RepID=R0IEH4_EXST2|nr:uncharacterized protein SETTUDRAFT_164149 [Exserohilum turcica Et28A]EOA83685.1 hypothetical protein SETTUDRAFT_164149 [Exserohilum turcica Et28A]
MALRQPQDALARVHVSILSKMNLWQTRGFFTLTAHLEARFHHIDLSITDANRFSETNSGGRSRAALSRFSPRASKWHGVQRVEGCASLGRRSPPPSPVPSQPQIALFIAAKVHFHRR